jgi:succinyl-CoA synthetase beta subunit
VKAILINIFGGIMNCQTLARGVIHAATELQTRLPIVVRMEGTHVEQGKKLFQKSSLKVHTAEDLDQAAKLAVSFSKG